MVISVYLEARFFRTSKFYEMILDKEKIIFHYGKINGKEKEVIKIFKNEIQAKKFFNNKTNKQLLKKYIKTNKKEQLKLNFLFENPN